MLTDVPQEHPLLVQFREDPYTLYRYLLAAAPVQWNDLLGAWTLARYADVVEALTDPRYSADRSIDYEYSQFAKSMLVSDPPDHTRLRALVQKAFTPRMIEQLRPRVIAIVGELLDRIAEKGGRFDLIADLAYPLPVVVIAELLGVPATDRATFHDWSAAVAASLDPLVSSEMAERAAASRDALHAYFRSIIAERRSEPKSDLISALVAVEERGDVLSEPELVVMCNLLLIAGHETTVNLIGNGVLALLRNPDQLERLRTTPELLGSAIEELLRYDSPVQLTGPHRQATRHHRRPGRRRRRLGSAPARRRQSRPSPIRRSRQAGPVTSSQPAPGLRPRHSLLPGRHAGPSRRPDSHRRPHPPFPKVVSSGRAHPPRSNHPARPEVPAPQHQLGQRRHALSPQSSPSRC
jgi:cytochrome P450